MLLRKIKFHLSLMQNTAGGYNTSSNFVYSNRFIVIIYTSMVTQKVFG